MRRVICLQHPAWNSKSRQHKKTYAKRSCIGLLSQLFENEIEQSAYTESYPYCKDEIGTAIKIFTVSWLRLLLILIGT